VAKEGSCHHVPKFEDGLLAHLEGNAMMGDSGWFNNLNSHLDAVRLQKTIEMG